MTKATASTYGAGDGSRKASWPFFVDVDGRPIKPSVLKEVRAGTTVRLICDQKPYQLGPNIGTSMKVVAMEIVELVTGDGAPKEPADLSLEDVVAHFRNN